MILLLLLLMSSIGSTVYFYQQLPSHLGAVALRQNRAESTNMVRIKEVTGSAQVKSTNDMGWQQLKSGMVLQSDSQIVTLSDSFVELQFIDDEALLRIPDRTFLKLDSPFLVSSKMRRVFFLETTGAPALSELVKKYADPLYARVHWVFRGQPEVARLHTPKDANGLALQKESRVLTRIAPKGDISLLVTSFPVYVSVSFLNPDPKKMKIHGYLWNDELGSEPVWEGETESYFSGIPITRKGSFVFQAFSDNDTYVSLPLRIQAQTLLD